MSESTEGDDRNGELKSAVCGDVDDVGEAEHTDPDRELFDEGGEGDPSEDVAIGEALTPRDGRLASVGEKEGRNENVGREGEDVGEECWDVVAVASRMNVEADGVIGATIVELE